MNAKKLKRILCVALSLSMALSGNMTAFAAEANVPDGRVSAVAEDMAADDAAQEAADEAAVADGAADQASDDAAGITADAADETKDSAQADAAEEGVAEDAAQELSGGKEADEAEANIMPFADGEDPGTGSGGTEEPGGSEDPAPAPVIVVCDNPDKNDANQKATLSEAITAATQSGATATTIRLEKDVELSGTVPDLANVTIEANGHTITIPASAEVTLANAKINNAVAKVKPILDVRGKLTIQGGVFTTKGVCVLSARGEARIQKSGANIPQFTATIDDAGESGYYFDKAVIEVIGINGKLNMESGKIEASALDTTKKNGMYGIALFDGAEIELGTAADAAKAENSNSDVIVNSGCPAISMNGLHAPGKITIHSGTYTSVLEEDGAATGDTQAKFNSVIYLPAAATVEIEGGVFEHKGAKNSSVISIPYHIVNGSSVRLNLNITGGSFKAPASSTETGVTNKVFRLGTNVFADANSKMNITVSGGTFSSDIKNELNGRGISEDFEVYKNGDGTFGVQPTSVAVVGDKKFNSFKEAVATAEAITGGEKKLTLNQNVTLTENLTINGIAIETSGKMITIPEGVKLTLNAVTVKNDLGATYVTQGVWSDDEKNRTIFHVDGELDIQGGTYETKGVHMIRVSGTAKIGNGATLSCTAGTAEYTAANAGNYDGAPLISVTGKRGALTITDATVNANVGEDNNNGSTDGMYGIYVNYGAKLTLGTKPSGAETAAEESTEKSPKIEAKLAAIGMNGTTAPGTIVIEDGTYISHAASTKQGLAKFNSVLYFPATANVTINGGTFENQGTNAPSYVISVPYVVDPSAKTVKVKLNLIINGGTFQANASAATKEVFFDAGMESTDELTSLNRISIRGGEFNCKPKDDYVAGCCTATPDDVNSPTKWTVEAGTAGAHTLSWVAKKEATCWDEGVIGHYECLKCHRMYQTKKDKEDTLPEKFAIPREEHGEDYQRVEEKAATCIADGIKEGGYYQCNKCEMCYPNLAAMEQDEKGVGETPEAFAVKAVGHKYQTKPGTTGSESRQAGEEEGTDTQQVPDAAFTGWDAFAAAVKEGTDVSEAAELLKATRTCSEEKCKHKLEAASVTVEQVGDGSLSGSCDTVRTVKYVAKATFTEDEYEKPIANAANYVTVTSDAREVSLPKGSHTYTVEGDPGLTEGEKPSLKFDWSNFSSADYVAEKSNGVKVSGSCSVCGTPIPADTTVAVTCTKLPEGVTDVKSLTCTQSAEFTATAKSGADLIREVEKTLMGDHNLTVGGTYQAASCTEAGRKAYYTCEGCGKNYWDEADAKEGNVIKDAAGEEVKGEIAEDSKVLEIPKKDHTFKLTGFAWADKEKTKAKATLRCTGCYGTVVVGDLEVTPPTEEEKPKDAPCGGNVIWNYHVALDFDKTYVEEGKDGFTYVPVSETPDNTETPDDTEPPVSTAKKIQHYEGTLPKTVKQPHVFTKAESTEETEDGSAATDPVVQLSWADGGANTAERVPSAHIVKAKVTCQKCKKYVTVKENSGPLDGDDLTNMDVGTIIPIITKELDTTPAAEGAEAKTYEATCQGGGRSTYKVTVTYRDDNGVMQKLAENEEIDTKTPQDPDAHNWTALEWEWEQVTTGTEENEKPVMTTVTKDGKTYTVPDYRIKATRYCQNSGCQTNKEQPQVFLGRLGTAPGENDTSTENPSKWEDLTPSAGATVQISTDTVEKTCIKSGKTTYTATALLNDKEVAKNPTPAIYNDPPKGHQIVFDWKWKEETNGAGGPVIGFSELLVTRSCSECSHKPVGTDDRFAPVKYKVVKIGDGTTTGGTVGEDGNIKDSILTVKRTGNAANCTTAGQVTYEATLKLGDLTYTNERSLVNAALGHDVKMFIDWRETTAAEGQTIAEREKWVPWLVKKCSRENCPGGEDVKTEETKLALLTGDAGYQYELENCTDPGEKVWATSYTLGAGEAWDKSQFWVDDEGNQIVETLKHKETIDPDTNKHVYGKGTAKWDPAPQNLGSDENNFTDFDEVLSVTLSRTCSKCTHVDKYDFDARVSEEGKPKDCSEGYTVEFSVSKSDWEQVKDIEFVEEAQETPEPEDTAAQMPQDGTEEKLFNGKKSYTVEEAPGRANHVLRRFAGGNMDNCGANTHPTYYECQRCKKAYTTQSALTEYNGPKEEDETAVLGHLYGEPEFRWIEEGKTAEAIFTCKRSGCPDKENGGHKYRLVVRPEEDPYIEVPPKCIGMPGETGKGRAWGLLTVVITAETAEGGLNIGQRFEKELEMTLPAGKHEFNANGKCKWCGLTGQVEVTFKKDAVTEISTEYYGENTSAEGITVPTAPNRYNYVFVGWKFQGEEDSEACGSDAIAGKIAEKIAAALENASGAPEPINVMAVYKEAEQTTVTITIQNVYRTQETGQDPVNVEPVTERKTEENISVGSEYTATPAERKGSDYSEYKFSHWEMDEKVVSTNESYLMIVQGSVTLKAVYMAEGHVESQPTAVMTEVSAKEVDGAFKLSFASAMDIPEGYTLVDSGFVYFNKGTIADADLNLSNVGNTDPAKNVRKKSLGGDKTNIFTLNLGTTNANNNTDVYIKAYLRCSKGEKIVDVYSDMVITSYNKALELK
ncbi:MAG: hypothetical protein HFH39_10010 [Lachnospiraceae bacterium]|nr:hypothetical protein [Lachnospiraceae bacterium]